MTTSPTEWDWSRPIFDHVHLRVADLAASRAFYAEALRPLGIPLMLDTPQLVAFANLALSADGRPSERVHIAFAAPDRATVDAFHAAGLAAGGRDNGAPGERAYGPPNVTPYAAFLLDRAPRTKSVVGNNIEAVHRTFAG